MSIWIVAVLLVLAPVASAQTTPTAGAPAAGGATDSVLMDIGEVLDELLTPEPYYYQSAGRRDPFASLISPDGGEADGEPGVADLVVVGILWGDNDRFALVETRDGHSLILRKGDPIRDGRVLEVSPEGLRVVYSHYGIVKTMTLPVVSGVEGRDER
jgi:hypothetical protein